jgi:hypothetical protein
VWSGLYAVIPGTSRGRDDKMITQINKADYTDGEIIGVIVCQNLCNQALKERKGENSRCRFT